MFIETTLYVLQCTIPCVWKRKRVILYHLLLPVDPGLDEYYGVVKSENCM